MATETANIKLQDRQDIEAIEARRADKAAFDGLKITAGTSKSGGMKKAPSLGRLKRMMRSTSITRIGGTRGQGRGVSAAAAGGESQHLQRCAVRAQYSKNLDSKPWSKHADYIEREGTGGQSFDAENDEGIDIAKVVDEWQKSEDQHMFRLIISPEFGDRVDLKKVTRDTISEIERDLGTKLQWAAICHFDTDNPHVHIALRGRDHDGNTLRINPAYLQKGLRTRAQEATTQQLGFRQQKDIELAQQRQITQQRFTDLDRGILKQLNSSRVIAFTPELPRNHNASALRLKQIGRLAELEKMGLAKRVGALAWRVDPTIESALRTRQQAQDMQKSLNAAKGLISDPAAQLERVSFSTPGQVIVGRYLGAGFDDVTSRAYILIESPNRRLYYIDQTREIEQQKAHLRPGKWVSLEAIEPASKQHRKVELIVTVSGDKTLSDEVLDNAILASVQEGERARFREASKEALQEAVSRQADARASLVSNMALQAEVNRVTFSKVDQSITEATGPDGVIKFSKAMPTNKIESALRLQQVARLTELEKLGLATPVGKLAWKVTPGLEDALNQRLKSLNIDKPIFTGRPLSDVERQILSQTDRHGRIKFSNELPASPAAKAARLQQISRLGELERMGLAQRTGALSWKVQPDLQIALALRENEGAHDKLKDLAKQVAREIVQDVKDATRQGIQNSATGAAAATLEAASGQKTVLLKEDRKMESLPEIKPSQALTGQGWADVAAKPEPDLKAPKTVSAEFQKASAARTEELLKAGVLESTETGLKVASAAQEKLLDLIAKKEGMQLQPRNQERETVGAVVGRRGEFAIVKDVQSGQLFAHKSKSLEAGDVVNIGKGAEPKLAVTRPAKLHELVHEAKVNRLDLMLKHERAPNMPAPVRQALNDRREFWSRQQVEVGAKDWIRVAHARAQELQRRRELQVEQERKRQDQARRKAQQISR